MSWQESTTGAPLLVEATSATTASDPVGIVGLTSLSTILLPSSTSPVDRLRTYGLTSMGLVPIVEDIAALDATDWSCGQEAPSGACSAVADPCATGDLLGYVDSGVVDPDAFDCTAGYTTPDPRLVLVVDEGGCAAGTCGSTPIRSTCIPTELRHCEAGAGEWTYEFVGGWPATVEVGATGAVTDDVVLARADARFRVTYKDPSVVELPSGAGWLMLLSRVRWYETVEAAECTACGKEPAPDSQGLGDIVAWWADNPDFVDGARPVAGPFLVVDSLEALPGFHLRLWLSVPGGAFSSLLGDSADAENLYLYVYYQVEPQSDQSMAEFDPVVTAAGYEAALRGYAFTGEATRLFTPGPAVKRIALQDLLDHVGLTTGIAAGSSDQATWTLASAIPGDLLGQVRVWCCGEAPYDTPYNVRSFDLVYRRDPAGAPRYSPELADPAPVSTSLGLDLFFSAINLDPGVVSIDDGVGGYGVWRGVAVPETSNRAPVELTNWIYYGGAATVLARVTPTHGVDFVVCVAENPATGLPQDQLCAADSLSNLVDPDPVLSWDGTWRVYVGVPGGPGGGPGDMRLYLGASADGSSAWTDAWCSTGADDDTRQAAGALGAAVSLPWLAAALDAGGPPFLAENLSEPQPIRDGFLTPGSAFRGVTVEGGPAPSDCPCAETAHDASEPAGLSPSRHLDRRRLVATTPARQRRAATTPGATGEAGPGPTCGCR